MSVEYIQTIYRYNAWANERILNASQSLSSDQFMASVGASFPSVRDTLVHTMGGQWVWLSRWQGSSPGALPGPADFPDLKSIREAWQEIETGTRTFVDHLGPGQLPATVAYVDTRGEPHAFPLWQLMVHQVNHATQHRSEIAAMLTSFGHSPGGMDMLLYYMSNQP